MTLCANCSNQCFTCDVGHCRKCFNTTSSGMISLCNMCAIELNECGACHHPLRPTTTTPSNNNTMFNTTRPVVPAVCPFGPLSGNQIGPNNPIFNNSIPSRNNPTIPSVPPRARFDPFGPPGTGLNGFQQFDS
jgi:hypothetical protein